MGLTITTLALVVDSMKACTLFAPLSGIITICAICTFVSNVILFRSSVPTLLTRRLNLEEDWWKIPLLLIALPTSYMMTSSMIVSLLSIGALSFIAQPYIAIPIFLIAFAGNAAFVQTGLLQFKTLFQKLYKGVKEQYGKYNEDHNVLTAAFLAFFTYILDIKKGESSKRIALKIGLFILKLACLGLVTYASQFPLVRDFVHYAYQWTLKIPFTHFLSFLASWIPSFIIIACIGRSSILMVKINNLWNQRIASLANEKKDS